MSNKHALHLIAVYALISLTLGSCKTQRPETDLGAGVDDQISLERNTYLAMHEAYRDLMAQYCRTVLAYASLKEPAGDDPVLVEYHNWYKHCTAIYNKHLEQDPRLKRFLPIGYHTSNLRSEMFCPLAYTETDMPELRTILRAWSKKHKALSKDQPSNK